MLIDGNAQVLGNFCPNIGYSYTIIKKYLVKITHYLGEKYPIIVLHNVYIHVLHQGQSQGKLLEGQKYLEGPGGSAPWQG